MSALEIILHDEVQFLDFGESRSAGPWIKLRLKDPDQLHTFRSLNPKECPVFNLTLSAGPILAEQEPETPDDNGKAKYGVQACTLRLSSFFRTASVWQAVGTDAEFLAWVRQKKCCVCGTAPPSEAAHVRRIANGAGTGIKPPYSAISLCHECHARQHASGESAIGGKEMVDMLRIDHVQEWCWQKLKADLGYDHWNELPPSVLQEWAGSKGLGHLLPSGYIE